ncbi:helix-turn-helix domain-containing protein [Algisphaera agarilytica]|uniref:AraC-like DNA-binding protein n=1 Tax=Algisphaera agarilytica TaxID=1385975 RepID=A0A7X0H2R9_9BACT|nr:AraC family transcriptional regulator [Algisphaera agarilytica]MBB6428213.1 AraC-like DNA-binding protein [Algisphaera agarilytica]
MQPSFEHVVYPEDASFAALHFDGEAFDCPYHIHPEIELLWIESGRGRRLVGDHVGRFEEGELYLFGPDLPHMFYSDPPRDQAVPAKSRYAQFRPDCLGEDFFDRPEMKRLSELLKRADSGIVWPRQAHQGVAERLGEIQEMDAAPRVVALLEMLILVDAQSANGIALASRDYTALATANSDRISRAIDYVHRQLEGEVTLDGAARAANLSPGAFSRFFRKRTGQRFIDFVIDQRLGEACRLLAESDEAIGQIALQVGFNNLSNFNRQFLKRKGLSPSVFRKNLVEG